MSKFKVGDVVKIVSLTDVDAEYDDPNRVVTDNETATRLFGAGFPLIGDVGVIKDILCDYYDVTVRFNKDDWAETNDFYSFVEADLELVDNG